MQGRPRGITSIVWSNFIIVTKFPAPCSDAKREKFHHDVHTCSQRRCECTTSVFGLILRNVTLLRFGIRQTFLLLGPHSAANANIIRCDVGLPDRAMTFRELLLESGLKIRCVSTEDLFKLDDFYAYRGPGTKVTNVIK